MITIKFRHFSTLFHPAFGNSGCLRYATVTASIVHYILVCGTQWQYARTTLMPWHLAWSSSCGFSSDLCFRYSRWKSDLFQVHPQTKKYKLHAPPWGDSSHFDLISPGTFSSPSKWGKTEANKVWSVSTVIVFRGLWMSAGVEHADYLVQQSWQMTQDLCISRSRLY